MTTTNTMKAMAVAMVMTGSLGATSAAFAAEPGNRDEVGTTATPSEVDGIGQQSGVQAYCWYETYCNVYGYCWTSWICY